MQGQEKLSFVNICYLFSASLLIRTYQQEFSSSNQTHTAFVEFSRFLCLPSNFVFYFRHQTSSALFCANILRTQITSENPPMKTPNRSSIKLDYYREGKPNYTLIYLVTRLGIRDRNPPACQRLCFFWQWTVNLEVTQYFVCFCSLRPKGLFDLLKMHEWFSGASKIKAFG